MKYQILTALIIVISACLQTVQAHSSLWNIDGSDNTKLKKIGITIKTLPHGVGQIDGTEWIQIAFDTSKLGKDEHALMVLQIGNKNGKFISGHRSEQKKGGANKVTMSFALNKDNIRGSSFNILITKSLPAVKQLIQEERLRGNPRFGGYTLSLKRIIDLASKTVVNKTTKGDKN